MVLARPFACAVLLVALAIGGAHLLGSRDLWADRQDVPSPASSKPACTVCHPGSRKSLARSAHAALPEQSQDASCLQCHRQGLAHQQHPRSSEHPAGKGRDACASCHAGIPPPTAARARALAHPTRGEARQAEREPPSPTRARELEALARPTGPRLGWEGLVRAGWRFVDVHGDERAFDHDLGLDAGPRLSRLRLRAHRDERTLAEGSVQGLEDRDLSARVGTGAGLSERVGADASFRRHLWVYDAEGDYHTLSNSREWTRGALWVAGEEDARLRLEFERLDLDGRTIGSRIGNPNQSPLVPALGVPVDRVWTSDLLRLGYEDRLGAAIWSVELAWEETRGRDDLTYARPSPANPGFTESEVSSSRTSQRGPEALARVVLGEEDALFGQVVLTAAQHDVRFVERGLLTAYDSSAFTTDTLGLGEGDRRRLALVAQGSGPLWEGARLAIEGELADVRDDVRFTLFETTTRTSPPLVVRTQTDRDLLTRVRDRSVRAAVEQSLPQGLDLDLGWRYLEQYLLLPDLEAADADYRAGTVRTHGPDLAAMWRPDDLWSLRVRWSLATTGSRTPTETQPEIGHVLSGRLRRRFAESDGWAEVFGKWRRGENDVSSTEIDHQSFGAALSFSPVQDARLLARGTWAQIRSETLTNFYLAPSVAPIPTLVRFRGDSLLFDVELDVPISRGLHSVTVGGLQTTDGSLDSTLVRIDQELVYEWTDSLSIGVQASFVDFDEDRQGAEDDYDARIGFLFAEFKF